MDYKGKHWAWRVHQFWFNFAGSAVGWGVTWSLAVKLWRSSACEFRGSINISDAFLGFIAFVGITGFLPFATFGLLQGLKGLASKLAELGK